MMMGFHPLSRNWDFQRCSPPNSKRERALPAHSWCTQVRPHGFWLCLCCNYVSCIKPSQFGYSESPLKLICFLPTHNIQETDLDLFWITAHCCVALDKLADLSVLKVSVSVEGLTSTLNCGLENLKRWLWNDLHSVYLVQNLLNGSISYFYLPKEIEVGEGIGSQTIELGSTPLSLWEMCALG